MRSLHTKLERVHVKQQRPSAAKNKLKIIKKRPTRLFRLASKILAKQKFTLAVVINLFNVYSHELQFTCKDNFSTNLECDS